MLILSWFCQIFHALTWFWTIGTELLATAFHSSVYYCQFMAFTEDACRHQPSRWFHLWWLASTMGQQKKAYLTSCLVDFWVRLDGLRLLVHRLLLWKQLGTDDWCEMLVLLKDLAVSVVSSKGIWPFSAVKPFAPWFPWQTPPVMFKEACPIFWWIWRTIYRLQKKSWRRPYIIGVHVHASCLMFIWVS